MRLLLATKNKGKVVELRSMLDELPIEVSSLLDFPEIPDVIEDGITFLENARKKAVSASSALNEWTLADDTGLVVSALGGAPGVYSARYAGSHADYAANNLKLLEEMKGVHPEKRGAAFVCVVVLHSPDGREWSVEGRCEGSIGVELRGDGGFGYDPLFMVDGLNRSMAELTLSEKNRVSHRGEALRKIKELLIRIIKEDKSASGSVE